MYFNNFPFNFIGHGFSSLVQEDGKIEKYKNIISKYYLLAIYVNNFLTFKLNSIKDNNTSCTALIIVARKN